jgi:hypothetical protein
MIEPYYLSVILAVIVAIYLGYSIAKGIDNNHRELFQGFTDEILKLHGEVEYWKNCYELLEQCVRDSEHIKDTVKDGRGNIIQIYFKE